MPFHTELFQILKDDVIKVLHSTCQQIWKTQQWPQDQKRSIFIPTPKKGNAKEIFNYCTTALISHSSKVMLKILQARLQQCMNHELPDVQAEFRKSRGTRDQMSTSVVSQKNQGNSRKASTFVSLATLKPLTVWITTVEVSSRDENTRSPYFPPEKPVCRKRSNNQYWTWNNRLVQLGRSMSRLNIVTLLI